MRAGSSPRPWGTLDGEVPKPELIRFIPTPVGNTILSIISNGDWTVHPHARGEHELPM